MYTIDMMRSSGYLSVYKNDRTFQAYDNNPNGHDLLANIPVRRAGGPLTSVRKIGPELSKKLHALYTKTDPNFVL